MPPELLPPYPCNEHQAHFVLALFMVTWSAMLTGLVVQAVREKDVQFIAAVVRYLLRRRRILRRRAKSRR